MNSDYKVGDLIYDANIYDAMNTNLDDLHFYKRWLPETGIHGYLNFVVVQAGLLFPLQRKDMILPGLITPLQCLLRQRIKLLEQD